MTYPSRLRLYESIGLLRTWRFQLRIVQCPTIRGRDLQRLSRQRVSEGGKRQNIVSERPAVRIRKRVMVGGHRCSAEPGRDGPEDVGHRRAGFELAAGEVRGPNREIEVVIEPHRALAIAFAGRAMALP